MTTTVAQNDTKFFGHPRGLATLFFTEMWERFSYYGMRALLILFMVAPVASGGLGFDKTKAGAIYGLYTGSVYLMCLPGGWIADRILGPRRAVLFGGILIACGHVSLFLPFVNTFYLGLFLIVMGTGLLKPNVSALVGSLYSKDDIRKDSGFSLFYMGINTGATFAPIFCGYVGQRVNWHWGFGLAALGMFAGLVQFFLGAKYFPELKPEKATVAENTSVLIKWGGLAAALLLITGVLHFAGAIELTAVGISNTFGVLLLLSVVISFGGLLLFGDWNKEERKRLWVVLILFLSACIFWSLFEQAGSTLNLFAEEHTLNEVFGMGFPASWMQFVQPASLIIFSPVFAALWFKLGDRGPSTPMKFVFGLVCVGLSFFLMAGGARTLAPGIKASAMYLIGCYVLHAIGEVCLSPVGLSAMTRLAPRNLVGLMMGLWFMATSVGNFISGRVAGLYEGMPIAELFTIVGMVGLVAAVFLLFMTKPIVRLMGGVR